MKRMLRIGQNEHNIVIPIRVLDKNGTGLSHFTFDTLSGSEF